MGFIPAISAARDVNMYVVFFIEVFGDIELPCFRPGVTQGSLRRLLHYITEMSGKNKVSLSLEYGGLYIEYFSSGLSPGKASSNPDLALLLLCLRQYLGDPKKVLYNGGSNFGNGFSPFCYLPWPL